VHGPRYLLLFTEDLAGRTVGNTVWQVECLSVRNIFSMFSRKGIVITHPID
jgi:hypothetical protein